MRTRWRSRRAIILRVFASDSSAAGAAVALVFLLAGLDLSVAMAVTVHRLMGVLGGVPALWALGMFVPLLNILLLLVINARSQAWCRKRGIQVGFLGPTPESTDRLRHGG